MKRVRTKPALTMVSHTELRALFWDLYTIFCVYWKTLCLDPLTSLSGQVHGWNLCRGNRQQNLLSRECSENIIHLSRVYVCKNILSTLFILTSDGLCSARGLSLDTSILLPPSPRTPSALWTLLQFSPSLPASDIYSVNIYSALTVHRDLELGNVSSYLFTVWILHYKHF